MRRRALLCVLVAAWLAVWVPPAWASFHLERADRSTPVKGINLAPYVTGGRTFGKPVGTLQVARPRPKVAPAFLGPVNDVYPQLADCESGGDPSTNTGNGYYGLYQFSPSTWRATGGSGMPHHASAAEQTRRAQIAADRWGFRSQFPGCSAKLGLR